MRHFTIILALLIAIAPAVAYAKRPVPPEVAPITYEGVQYVVPNDNGRRAYVQAWDTTTSKLLWEVTIFRNHINPFKEEDVQHVYIKKMRIHGGNLILIAEDGRVYSLNLKTRAVEKLKQAPPEEA